MNKQEDGNEGLHGKGSTVPESHLELKTSIEWVDETGRTSRRKTFAFPQDGVFEHANGAVVIRAHGHEYYVHEDEVICVRHRAKEWALR